VLQERQVQEQHQSLKARVVRSRFDDEDDMDNYGGRQDLRGGGRPRGNDRGCYGGGSTGAGKAGATRAATAAAQAELSAANAKLRRQVEHLKGEVAAATAAYERLRVEAAKEAAKLKMRLSAALTGAPGLQLGLGLGLGLDGGDAASHDGHVAATAMTMTTTAAAASAAPLRARDSSLGRLDATRGPVGARTTSAEREAALRRRIAALERDLALIAGGKGAPRAPSRPQSVGPGGVHGSSYGASGSGRARTPSARSVTPTGRGRSASTSYAASPWGRPSSSNSNSRSTTKLVLGRAHCSAAYCCVNAKKPADGRSNSIRAARHCAYVGIELFSSRRNRVMTASLGIPSPRFSTHAYRGGCSCGDCCCNGIGATFSLFSCI
jgi:hypothetical protein